MEKDVLRKGVFFALQEPANVADPYPLYDRLRSESPFHWDFVLSAWFLTRYADVSAALVDPRLSTENFTFDVSQLPADLQGGLAPLGRIRKREALYNDASEHERLRRPLNRAFNPAAFENVRSAMETLAEQLLTKAERRSSMDVVRDYAQPLADFVMSELLGLPHADRAEFVGWCNQLEDFVTAPRMGQVTVLKGKLAVKSIEAVRNYVRRMITNRREKFADDVIGRSLAVEPNEALPTEDEMLANCVFFLHAGVGNMAASIANAVLALLRHPQEWAHLRKAPDSIGLAVEELLRYDTPLHVAIRGVHDEMRLGNRRIGPKHLLVLLLGAANRDPKQFAAPHRLDLKRRPNRHVSFGVGPHGCVGAWLARFGLTIAIGTILERNSSLRLATKKLQWNFPAMRRTMRALPVFVDRRVRHSGKSQLCMARALESKLAGVAQAAIQRSQ